MKKISNLRFDVILAQYLNQHKKLNLPGIGTFETDNSSTTWDENGKQKQAGSGIVFRNTPVARADDDLIAYITEQTGKMKPLAISDLESYLTLGKQFLYIGKPFYLEGIGTLQFAKGGSFEFIPGEYVTTKLEDPSIEKVDDKNRAADGEERQPRATTQNTGRPVLTWLIILLCLGLVGWGGYYFYTVNAGKRPAVKDNQAAPVKDSALTGTSTEPPAAKTNVTPEPRHTDPAASVPVKQSYYDNQNFRKYVVEKTTDKERAINRYKKLKAFGNDIEMETADSVTYSLFFVLPSTTADTLRIRDSLNRWYYGNGKNIRVTVQ